MDAGVDECGGRGLVEGGRGKGGEAWKEEGKGGKGGGEGKTERRVWREAGGNNGMKQEEKEES